VGVDNYLLNNTTSNGKYPKPIKDHTWDMVRGNTAHIRTYPETTKQQQK
jgi:hypothetical protein